MELSGKFVEEMNGLLGDDACKLLAAVRQREATVAVRLNASKPVGDALAAGDSRVAWCPYGRYLDARAQFTFDPLLHAGAYYVQDASSAVVWHIVNELVHGPVRYLDLCAAPGGKTTAAIDALPEGSLVVANEIMPARAQILKENVAKWGSPGCVVTCNDSRAFASLEGFFDVVAADVPCSGEGMFRKDQEAVAQWSPALVRQCAARQREILASVWPALRQGGLLIYSTCTYNRSENEAIVEYVIDELGAESVGLDIPSQWGISRGIGTNAHCMRFFPHRTRGEGLFVAVLRKTAASGRPSVTKGKPAKPAQVPDVVKHWLRGDFEFSVTGNSVITAIPHTNSADTAMLRSRLKTIAAGVEVATVKGRDIIPAQPLALSTAYDPSAFHSIDVDYATAIAYLRGETIAVDAPRGYTTLTYRRLPLGFVKNLGNRANNLYPKEWRIRSSHIPQSPPAVI